MYIFSPLWGIVVSFDMSFNPLSIEMGDENTHHASISIGIRHQFFIHLRYSPFNSLKLQVILHTATLVNIGGGINKKIDTGLRAINPEPNRPPKL